jgi:endonuclease-3
MVSMVARVKRTRVAGLHLQWLKGKLRTYAHFPSFRGRSRVCDKERKRACEIDGRLEKLFPDALLALNYGSPLELLIAVILSAQCTDERVNQVTRTLFSRFKTAADWACLPLNELEELLRPTGFYRNKAKNVQSCCRAIVDRFGGEVPRTVAELTSLPGVGRKTANMVIGNAFYGQAIAVDTHVKRIAMRLGLTSETDPDGIERALTSLLPEERWTVFSNRAILFGRHVCQSRSPRC